MHVLEGLRSIDPRTDVLWWGARDFLEEGPAGKQVYRTRPCWLVGVYEEHAERRQQAERKLVGFDRNLATLRLPQDRVQRARLEHRIHQRRKLWLMNWRGLRTGMFYPFGDLDWAVVEDWRFRDYIWRHHFAPAIAEKARQMDDEAAEERRIVRMKDYIEAELPGQWRYVFKGRRSVAA